MIPVNDVLSLVVGRNGRQRIGMNGMEGIAARMGVKKLDSINVQH